MMVNNCTNNNKTNNQLSTSLTEHIKGSTSYDIGIPVPNLEQAQTCDGVKTVNMISALHS